MGKNTPENAVKKKIREWLTTIPGIWFVPYVPWGYGRPGVPDTLACLAGRLIGIEVKAPGKKPTPRQESEHEKMRAAGALIIAADAVETVETAMRAAFPRHVPLGGK